MAPSINSLVWATDIDVLAPDHTADDATATGSCSRRSNPTFWWGNFLLFDDAPAARRRRSLGAAVRRGVRRPPRGDAPDVRLGPRGWRAGAAEQEFVARGYELEWTSGLIAQVRADQRARPRQRRGRGEGARSRRRRAALGRRCSRSRWPARARSSGTADYHRTFLRRRQARTSRDLPQRTRELVRGDAGRRRCRARSASSSPRRRARYQTVDTAEAFRRRGIARGSCTTRPAMPCSRHAIDHFVIAADPDYHAIGIYEGLGFERVELVVGAMRKPPEASRTGA